MSVLVCDACDSQLELGVHDGVDGLILSRRWMCRHCWGDVIDARLSMHLLEYSQAKCRGAIRKYSSRIQRTCCRVSTRRVMSLMYRGITLTDRETRRDEMRWLVPWSLGVARITTHVRISAHTHCTLPPTRKIHHPRHPAARRHDSRLTRTGGLEYR